MGVARVPASIKDIPDQGLQLADFLSLVMAHRHKDPTINVYWYLGASIQVDAFFLCRVVSVLFVNSNTEGGYTCQI
ncbi:hypothetical protein PTI98_012660 [Pleurotus ostreatus]|nr:hypothetical protein PTI98_012660 [Pleurotus ostreatus]